MRLLTFPILFHNFMGVPLGRPGPTLFTSLASCWKTSSFRTMLNFLPNLNRNFPWQTSRFWATNMHRWLAEWYTIILNHSQGWDGKPTGSPRDSRVAEISYDIQPRLFLWALFAGPNPGNRSKDPLPTSNGGFSFYQLTTSCRQLSSKRIYYEEMPVLRWR